MITPSLALMSTSELHAYLRSLGKDQLEELDSLLTTGKRNYEALPVLPGGYEFHPKQVEAWNSRYPIITICAGWQSGKTVLLSYWLRREIQRKGPGDYGAFSSTFKLLERKFLPELKETFKGLAEWLEGKQRFQFTAEGSYAMWGNEWTGKPTIIQLGHAEDPNSLESATLKAVAWDEPGQRLVPEQSFLTIESRLMVNRGRMCLASRPYDLGWYERLVKGLAPSLRAITHVVSFPSWECPANPPKDDPWWQGLRDRLQDWKFNMLYGGEFTRPAGAIYDCFSRKTHTVKRFLIPRTWQRYEGIDFGGVNTANIKGAWDPIRNKLVIYKCTLSGNKAVKEHVKEWEKSEEQFFEQPEGVFGPQARKNLTEPIRYGGAGSEDNWRTEFAVAEYPIAKPSYSAVEPGIQRVYSLIKLNMIEFFDDLSFLLDELDNYSWETTDDGEPIPGKIEDKAIFHRADSLRYQIAGVNMDFSEPTITNRNKKNTPEFSPKEDQDEDDDKPKNRVQSPTRKVQGAR